MGSEHGSFSLDDGERLRVVWGCEFVSLGLFDQHMITDLKIRWFSVMFCVCIHLHLGFGDVVILGHVGMNQRRGCILMKLRQANIHLSAGQYLKWGYTSR